MIATFDDTDRAMLAERQTALDEIEGPRVGDFVEFACGTVRRVSHIWAWDDEPTATHSIQTSDGGSFHLGVGYVSFSGGLRPGIPRGTLTDTGRTRDGSVWFFHHNRWAASNGVDTVATFRVFACSEVAR